MTPPIGQSNDDLIEEMRWQLEKIRNKQAENTELLGKLDSAGTELAALTATATAPDGTVSVTAGAGGIVRSVELADAAMSGNARTLSAAINATIQAAIADATTRQLEIVRAAVGSDVDPERVLGPQARFATYGTAPQPTRDQQPSADHDSGYDFDDEPYDPLFTR